MPSREAASDLAGVPPRLGGSSSNAQARSGSASGLTPRSGGTIQRIAESQTAPTTESKNAEFRVILYYKPNHNLSILVVSPHTRKAILQIEYTRKATFVF